MKKHGFSWEWQTIRALAICRIGCIIGLFLTLTEGIMIIIGQIMLLTGLLLAIILYIVYRGHFSRTELIINCIVSIILVAILSFFLAEGLNFNTFVEYIKSAQLRS